MVPVLPRREDDGAVNALDAAGMASGLMARWGLADWRFAFDGAVRRFGSCDHRTRTISLSRHLVALNDREVVRDTILHEIAHALVERHHGHDAVWRAKALEVGAQPDRTYGDEVTSPPARWVGTCPGCGTTIGRMRRLTLSCGPCGRGRWDPRYAYEWRLAGWWGSGAEPLRDTPRPSGVSAP